MGFQGSGRRVSRPGGLEIAGLGSKVRAQGLGFTIYKGLKFKVEGGRSTTGQRASGTGLHRGRELAGEALRIGETLPSQSRVPKPPNPKLRV